MRELERKIPDPVQRKAYLDAIIPELDRLIEKDKLKGQNCGKV
jgi:hypothetical protein